jgi:hypothetical protein
MKRTSPLLTGTTVYRGCRILLPETIKNSYYPKCVTCKHFILDSLYSTRFSKCKKFGKANLVSGEIAYDFADSCREMESKCGQYGKNYAFDEYHKAKNEMRKIKPFLTGGLFLSPFILILSVNIWKF